MTAKRWTADHKLCARHSEDASASEGGVLLARLGMERGAEICRRYRMGDSSFKKCGGF